jgi:mannose/fructose/N-acetylgalactosamine-specific phosphotransferase system component IIC
MTSDRLYYLFISFLQQLPSLLALLACIVFAITRWKRYPKVAMVVSIGLGLLLLHAIVFLFVYNFVPSYFIQSASRDYRDYKEIEKIIRNVYLVLGWISNSAAAVAFAVLLAGIFMGRKPTNELRET